MKTAVIGLGKLGLPLVAIYAQANHEVFAYDLNEDLVKKLSSGNLDFNEPDLNFYLNANRNKIIYTADMSVAVLNAEVISIIVPTPSIKGVFSNHIINEVLSQIGILLRNSDQYKLINLVSTVMPNSSVNVFIPLLESRSGKKIGQDFGFCYSPEFIALGSVLDNLLNPDMLLIGSSDILSANILEQFSKSLVNSKNIQTSLLTLTEAEIVKISVNNFITTKISFANMINQIADSFPNTSSKKILDAIGMDSRIGIKYLQPGTPFGGPCFPRDTIALSEVVRGKIKNDLPKLIDAYNNEYSEYTFQKILGLLKGKRRIGVIGISYKADTEVIEESFGRLCIEKLTDLGLIVNYWDSKFKQDLHLESGQSANNYSNLNDLVMNSEILILPRRLSEAELNELSSANHNLEIINLWS
jgi:UDPglucose 6-dehydrogenase